MLHRVDLLLAIYRTRTLPAKQRLWHKIRRALSESPRQRIYAQEKYQQPLSELMDLIAQQLHQGAPNGLF
jgi:hypothetical protein